ncbi:iron-containing redox enzyme family protein [Cellvibrio mixtus]|uniref:iron-containing redox enzyme family protein n=1 Tax=Cellvibrio mixtus TaxID=39650 RepID=UPI0005873A92|nr:iron-containing redox enzyme family protein [Cellvibrio mixtus]
MFLSSVGIEPQKFHTKLANFNRLRTAIGIPSADWEAAERDSLNMRILEGRFLEGLRTSIAPLTTDAPQNPDHFITWFESLQEWGPGQYHPLFDWLANRASADQLKWFLTQEAAGEAGFEDLVAYTQVKLPAQVKLECARNYWDEMGRGKYKAMHGPLLESMVKELGLTPTIDTTVWESLALANTMLGLATSRRHTYHSLGALGVIELTAPWRAAKVSLAMQRLNFPRRSRRYFDLHAKIDVLHAREWINEIIKPLISANPGCAIFIAEGALMRLRCGELCFDRYSKEMKIDLLHNLNARTLPAESLYA